ncbi:MAG TPA: hypothetical protein VJN72_15095 [Gaiellales bacterium]|nr:hypothetical protein [Gaiellales bacterium]
MGHRSLILGAASAAAGWTLLAAAPALAAGWHVAPSASPNGYKNQLQAVVRVPGTSQFWAAGYTLDQVGPCRAAARGSRSGAAVDNATFANSALVERSSGGSWSVVHAPAPPGSVRQSVTPRSAGQVWAVGSFVNACGVTRTLTERWNGAGWSIVPSANQTPGDNDALRSVIAVPGTGRLWAVGFSAAVGPISERWSGSAWTLLAPARPGQASDLEAVAAGPGTTWAVGSFIPTVVGSGPVERTLTERRAS